MTDKIIVFLEGGIIQSLHALATNKRPIEVEIRDFDTEGYDGPLDTEVAELSTFIEPHIKSTTTIHPGETS